MISQRQLFLQHVGQTSDFPMLLEIARADGIYLYDVKGKQYIDLVAGVSVSNVGHRNPKVVEAIKNQLDKYMHLMVYGEYVESPQVQYASLLTKQLPEELDCIYFVNSGSEANEGAMKLAKRYTRRKEIVAFKNAYHGSSHGVLSLMSDENFTKNFEPLLPGIHFIEFNNEAQLCEITEKTACVMAEVIQAEGGIILPENDFLKKLRRRCTETGALLILDEVQTGFGRLGTLFGFQKYGIVPDIFTIAKGMGGGLPAGGFVSSKKIMDSFKTEPVLGHITTFGGNAVCISAALASLQYLLETDLIAEANEKGNLFKKLLIHPSIKKVRGTGLFYAVEFENFTKVQQVIKDLTNEGIVTDWFLYADNAIRIAPPLIITENEIRLVCEKILKTI